MLRILEGLSVGEAAEIMGRTPGAISVLLNKAVKRLASVIAEMSVRSSEARPGR
jgi:DNA-directed RNA polymerase specialized sigma24 family protein